MNACLMLTMPLLTTCAPRSTQAEVEAALSDANYCEVADDCVGVGAVCPFGCNLLVNEAEKEAVLALLSEYEPECFYKCEPALGLDCEAGRCVAE